MGQRPHRDARGPVRGPGMNIRDPSARAGGGPRPRRPARPAAHQEARPELRHRPEHRAPHRADRGCRGGETVLEVGPGLGSLTLGLLETGRRSSPSSSTGCSRSSSRSRSSRPRSRSCTRMRSASRTSPATSTVVRRQPALQRLGAGDPPPARDSSRHPPRGWSWCRPRSANASQRRPARRSTARRARRRAWYGDFALAGTVSRRGVLAGAERRLGARCASSGTPSPARWRSAPRPSRSSMRRSSSAARCCARPSSLCSAADAIARLESPAWTPTLRGEQLDGGGLPPDRAGPAQPARR